MTCGAVTEVIHVHRDWLNGLIRQSEPPQLAVSSLFRTVNHCLQPWHWNETRPDGIRAETQKNSAKMNAIGAKTHRLQETIHIGPKRAEQIVALRKERPFRSIENLTRVKGIAEGRLKDIRSEGIACVRVSENVDVGADGAAPGVP